MPVLRVRQEGFFGSKVLAFLAFCIRMAVRVVGGSCRMRVVSGGEHIEQILREKKPVIFVMWHNRAALGACYLYRTLHRGGAKLSLLASTSQDGELVMHIARQWGMGIARGSSTRGGTKALRTLYRGITRDQSSPVLVPDGPRGPIYEFKTGVAMLARMSRAPVVPIGLAARRFHAIGSWDRLIIPWAFTRITVVVGAPQTVAPDLGPEDLELERLRLQQLLVDATEAAVAHAAAGAVTPSTGTTQ